MLATAMKCATSSHPAKAFTLVGLLVVILILAVLFWVVAVPTHPGSKQKAKAIVCLNNLHQTALGYVMWTGDHGDQYPWQVPIESGGTLELVSNGHASDHFRTLSNYVKNLRPFVCPYDGARHVTNSYENFSNQNLSYFVRLGELTNSLRLSVLAGDRHLQTDGQPVTAGLLVVSNNNVGWTRELHPGGKTPMGNVLFADGHTETIQHNLASVFRRQNSATNSLVIP
jgi:prepilin-type processing-associated H-X9-DG protein